MPSTIRQLRPGEAALYREIRLEALRLHPEAFSAAFETEAAQPLAFFSQRLAASTVFAGFAGDALAGIAGFASQPGPKSAHKAVLWGMYVRAPVRGGGLAKALVQAVLDHANGRAEQIHLSVTATNQPARRLYESFGFQPYGTEPRALKVDGRYLDDLLMARMLA